MRAPLYKALPPDGWVKLADAVLWVSYRGKPIPPFGSVRHSSGGWTDYGDRTDTDLIANAAEELRQALSRGKICAVGRLEGVDRPHTIDAGLWAGAYGLRISAFSFRLDGFRSILVAEGRLKELWPANSGTSATDWIAKYSGKNLKQAWADYQAAVPKPFRVTKFTFEQEWAGRPGARGRGRPKD